MTAPTRRFLAWWLFAVACLVFMLAMVGAATRLTGSGLSITEWQPVMGVVPPLSDADWLSLFAKYQTIPEYQLVNKGMSLDAFQTLFWWEWTHRLIARGIGFVVAVPLIALVARRAISAAWLGRLCVLLGLGGLEGLVGWYMVASGLSTRTDVSQYRLAMHLGVAILIFITTLWLAFRARFGEGRGLKYSSGLLVLGLIYLQAISGAFVAGLDAGLSHNTWPLMDGEIFPEGLLVMSPWVANFFENALTVQFDHRMLAYVVAAVVIWHGLTVRRNSADAAVKNSALWLMLGVFGQIALGIVTLLHAVPISLGIAHQAGAFIVIALATWHTFTLSRQARASA